jgi:hypothetical protein
VAKGPHGPLVGRYVVQPIFSADDPIPHLVAYPNRRMAGSHNPTEYLTHPFEVGAMESWVQSGSAGHVSGPEGQGDGPHSPWTEDRGFSTVSLGEEPVHRASGTEGDGRGDPPYLQNRPGLPQRTGNASEAWSL